MTQDDTSTAAAARALAAARQRVEKVCPVCGQTFVGLKKQVYDTNACAQRAAYQRHAEARRAQARERYRRARESAARTGEE